jgi:methylmalonyl-CoA mutase
MSESTLGTFQPTERTAWLHQVKKELNGAEYATLIWNHPELGAIEPFPVNSDSNFRFVVPPRSYRAEVGNWEIRQRFRADVNENAEVLKALMAGVNHVIVEIADDTTSDQLSELLRGVYLNMVALSFQGSTAAHRRALFISLTTSLDSPSELSGSVLFDPILDAFQENTIAFELRDRLVAHCDAIQKTAAPMRSIGVDASQIFEAGGGDALEVAIALLIGSEYLDAVLSAKGRVDDWVPKFEFQLAAGQSYFVTIAKFRALRYLWAHAIERYRPEHACSVVTWINAATAQRHFSANDQHNNLLRSTTSSLGALTGGCDSLEVTPFTPWEVTNEGRRWGRNIHHLLAEESLINPNEDAGYGSRYIEHLTTQLVEKVMRYLAEVEGLGGINTQAGLVWLQSLVASHRAQLIEQLRSKEQAIIGVNLFPPSQSVLEPESEKKHWLAPVRLPQFLFDQVQKS